MKMLRYKTDPFTK